ncbi:MAG TPA: DUF975 family protein [Candidatus Hydrogenedentes bacterium]|nr:DUF975 family protein [Candidatus Hydrogenedentota bacterium]
MNTLSTTENKELMAQARRSLEGRWGVAAGATAVFFLIGFGLEFIPYIGTIVNHVIRGALTIGLSTFFLALARGQKAEVSQLFSGFDRFLVGLCAYLLQALFVILWALLLIIPGIIASLSYAMTFFIIAENRDIGPLEAITKSKEMMYGNKWKFFCLGLRFIGWSLLCVVTLGIAALWVFPYMMVAFAKFYDDLKTENMVFYENADATVH